MSDRHIALAQKAAELWGGCVGRPRIVAQRENVVLDVTLTHGSRAALRVHRPDHQDLAAIETELLWTEALAGAGVNCPLPIRSVSGRLAEEIDTLPISLVQWIDAVPLSETAQITVPQFRRLGRCLAAFHSAADRLNLCPVPRHSWKAGDLIGNAPRWGAFRENHALTETELEFLQHARDTARKKLATLDHLDAGLIHADPLRENVLDDGTRLWLIDFDDSGWGYRGYDLGTALVQQAGSRHLPDLQSAIASGYMDIRPQAQGIESTLPLFMLIRGLATAGWIVPRVPANDPLLRLYAERALQSAHYFIGQEA